MDTTTDPTPDPAAVEAAARAEAERRMPPPGGYTSTFERAAFVAGAMWAAARAGDDTGACCDTVCNGKRTPGCAMSATPVPSSADDLRAEVERLRGRLDRRGWTVSRLQNSRDQVLARAEAAEREVADLRADLRNTRETAHQMTADLVREVADLRAGVNTLRKSVAAQPLVRGMTVERLANVTSDALRALAGSREQPGEDIDGCGAMGCARYHAVCPHRTAPVVPDSSGPVHFAPYGSTNAACDETVPRSVSVFPDTGEYDDARFTVRRGKTTCRECLRRLRITAPVVPDSRRHVHTTADQEAVIQDVATDVMDALGFHPQDDGRDDVAAAIRRHPGIAVVVVRPDEQDTPDVDYGPTGPGMG